jgi:hypothetical protein
LNQTLKAGDYVRLLKSDNPYVPVGTILKIESVSTVPDVFTVCVAKKECMKYFTHADIIRKVKYTTPEKVDFT